jgi:hypothetical protein
MAITLIPASVRLLPAAEANAESTSLVTTRGVVLPRRIGTAGYSGSACPVDNFIWSVATGEDGSFHFYAIPLKASASNSFSLGNNSQSSYLSGPVWYALNSSNAATQYQLSAGMPLPVPGKLLDVYA